MRQVLRNKRFSRLLFAESASVLGDSIFIVALAFAILDYSNKASSIAWVLGAGSIVLVISMLVSGVIADRMPRLPIMIISDIARGAIQAILALLLLFNAANLWTILVCYALFNLARAFFQPARTGVISQILSPTQLIAANGLLIGMHSIMMVIGMALGGLLVGMFGAPLAILIDAGTFVISALLLFSIGSLDRIERVEPKAFIGELVDGWREAAKHRWLILAISQSAAFLMFYEAPIQVLGPVFTKAEYSGAYTWGLLGAALAIGILFGSQLASMRFIPRPILLCLFLIFSTAVLPLLLLVHAPTILLLITNFVIGVSYGLWDTVWHATMQLTIPQERLARVSALDWMFVQAGMPIGYALTGAVVSLVGRDNASLLTAIIAFIICVWMLSSRAVRGIDFLSRGARHQ